MSQKRHTTEQTVNKLRQAYVELARRRPVAAVCKALGDSVLRRFHDSTKT